MDEQIKPVAWVDRRDLESMAFGKAMVFPDKADDDDLPLYDQQAIDTLRAEVERLRWRGIESLPDDENIILAKTNDGRVMIYRGSILARNLRGPTPEHLRFPAVKWMPVPGDNHE